MDKIYIFVLLFYVFDRNCRAFPDSRTKTRHIEIDDDETFGNRSNAVQERRFNSVSHSSRMGSDSDGKIIFPDETPTSSPMFNFKPKPLPSCRNKTYCDGAENYPEERIRIALRKNTELKGLAFVDQLTTNPNETNIDQRIDVSIDEMLCLSQETVVFPKTAENKHKEWRYIINDDNFPQGVRIETCVTENNSCRIIDGFAQGYRTMCKQKYIYRQLASITSDGSASPDLFRFPSSCCCHVQFVGSPMERMGFLGRPLERSSTSNAKSTN